MVMSELRHLAGAAKETIPSATVLSVVAVQYFQGDELSAGVVRFVVPGLPDGGEAALPDRFQKLEASRRRAGRPDRAADPRRTKRRTSRISLVTAVASEPARVSSFLRV